MIDRDTVVRLAEEAGLTPEELKYNALFLQKFADRILPFATLIQNEALERAAKEAEVPSHLFDTINSQLGVSCIANAIRALKDQP